MFLAGASGILKSAFSAPASKGSDIKALALYITSRSNGMKVHFALDQPKERALCKVREYLSCRPPAAGPQIRSRLLCRIEKPFNFGSRI